MRFFEHLSLFRHHGHHGHHGHPHGDHGRHAGRHGHRGFQGFGFGGEHGFPGDLGRGGHGLGPGRKLGSADLQLLILALLAEKPHHGYEIIKALDERSKGYYSPSPGMVYPALTYLEELGHASFETEGTKKLYSITVAGLAHLDENRGAADTLLQQLGWIGQRMEHLRRAMAQDGGPDSDAEAFDPFGRAGFEAADGARHGGRGERGRRGERGNRDEHGQAHSFAPELREAYHALKYVLGELRLRGAGIAADEQQRIAAILARAAAEIRGGGGSSGGAA
jgi:DNA-binding PadR family transcriptional regulator